MYRLTIAFVVLLLNACSPGDALCDYYPSSDCFYDDYSGGEGPVLEEVIVNGESSCNGECYSPEEFYDTYGTDFGAGEGPNVDGEGYGEVPMANTPAPVLTAELVHKILNALHLAEVAAGTIDNTLTWGRNDVRTFRQGDGSHVTNPQGSLIPWQHARVDWNLYGAGDPNLSDDEVFNNFLQSI